MYTATQHFFTQTPLSHEPNTDLPIILNISIHLWSKDFLSSGFSVSRQHSKKRQGLRHHPPVTPQTPRLHCHTQTHTKGHRRCIPLKLSGIALSHCINREDSLEDTNSILSPYYHLNAWEPAPLHTTEQAQRQLLAH